MEAPQQGKRVLEFYSGIGGMTSEGIAFLNISRIPRCTQRGRPRSSRVGGIRHQHLCKSHLRVQLSSGTPFCPSHFVFVDDQLCQKNLERITAATLDSYDANVWTLSPPCQPFSRNGNQRDDEDPRTKSLLVLLKLFSAVKKPPTYLMLENARDYTFQEVMLSPSDIGVPNSRLRYFLLAKRRPLTLKPYVVPSKIECFALSTILEHDEETSQKERLKAFLVPEATVTNQGVLFDVVKPADRRSCCFTKAYGRYVEGTGSVLQTNANARDGDVHDMRLRYLTPREIARLHCFPDDYGFPPDVTVKQQWKALGNSLNVRVVAVLLRTLFDDT